VEPRIIRLWINSEVGVFCFAVHGEECCMRLLETIEAYQRNDPAARSKFEIFWLYNGLHAQMYYRFAHWLYGHKLRFLARWVSQLAKRRTGVEIHPAATIGRRLVIDHGTGIVIGATAEIGDDCLLYQNVTLGGTGAQKGKRHPTLGNNVMVGAGAKVLGPFKVGDNARIAANSVVLKEVPANSTVVGVPGRVVKLNGEKLDHIHTPDPVRSELDYLRQRIEELEKQVLK
jgi:serine O-acetyltransferase